MKFVWLITRNLVRRKLRTFLNIFTLFIGSLLITLLLSVPASINRVIEGASKGLRVIVTAPNAYILPVRYCDIIKKMPGVVAVSAQRQWSGLYQNDPQPIVAFGVDPNVQETFPENNLTVDQIDEFLHERSGALVGDVLVNKYEWHLGQRVTLVSGDGRLPLTFTILAVLPSKISQNTFIFHRELFDEAAKRIYGRDMSDSASFIAVRVVDTSDIPRVIADIDNRFRNSEYETETLTESDAIANSVSSIADLGTIIFNLSAGVIVTMLLIVANSMATQMRERIPEVAVVRAIGFGWADVAMVLFGEAIAIGTIGGVAGAGLAWLLFGGGITMGAIVSGIGYMQVTLFTFLTTVFILLLVSFASAIIPVLQALRIPPALAFRKLV